MKIYQKLSKNTKKFASIISKKIKSKPTLFLFGSFALLVATVLAVGFFPKAEVVKEIKAVEPLPVKAIRFGDDQISADTTATLKNKSTITLVAQSAGPVKSINSDLGDTVWRGTNILQLETAYAAGNVAAVQRQIAQKSYQLASESLKNTVDTVSLIRSQADQVRENTEELRKISAASIDETKALISNLEAQLNDFQTLLDGATTVTEETTYRGSVISTQNFLNSSRASLRNLEYQVNTDNPPTDLANIQKDIIYKTTEIQLKSAEIQKQIAYLNLQAARIAEAATRVDSPIEGKVEKIFVEVGQYVSPGTPVAVITGEKDLQLSVLLSGELAQRIDMQQPLIADLGNGLESFDISYVSSVPVNGGLYELLADIPDGEANLVPEGSVVDVNLPLFNVSLIGANYMVPLDSVFITNNDSFVFVAQDGKAVKKSVVVGEIVGSNIEIISGLSPRDVVILDRRVIDGDAVDPIFEETQQVVPIELG